MGGAAGVDGVEAAGGPPPDPMAWRQLWPGGGGRGGRPGAAPSRLPDLAAGREAARPDGGTRGSDALPPSDLEGGHAAAVQRQEVVVARRRRW
ncbi:Os05g0359700 [Oryza sativa Japonica Group]|jgi:hypothetical protein|uniref:Os05g0359700 protein n=2 Tax=Oryza sativa subsp. japonica TaxID=39947 RepID=B7E8T6_ORYSJ|nr:unknown protein [Oryza sativa Japonica Group]BAF17220.1 Os05g0359700 [Oryza sativa Japonica Group]BAG88783.1 unnamed protein product [Oryza sativa Japonica Group]|eukprot:NP_001055306.1 Os05g0359700 [Oryza sativa Japonica Group]